MGGLVVLLEGTHRELAVVVVVRLARASCAGRYTRRKHEHTVLCLFHRAARAVSAIVVVITLARTVERSSHETRAECLGHHKNFFRRN